MPSGMRTNTNLANLSLVEFHGAASFGEVDFCFNVIGKVGVANEKDIERKYINRAVFPNLSYLCTIHLINYHIFIKV